MSALYHLGLEAAEVPAAVVIVEHGLDSAALRSLLEDPSPVLAKREFRSAAGAVAGEAVLVVDAGLGAPSTVIALEELVQAGARRVVWVGRCRQPAGGGAGPVVPVGAIRSDGTSRQYAPLAYPALPDHALAAALRTALCEPGWVELVETTDVVAAAPAHAQDRCSAALFVVGAARSAAVATVLLPEDADEVGAVVARAVVDAVAGREEPSS